VFHLIELLFVNSDMGRGSSRALISSLFLLAQGLGFGPLRSRHLGPDVRGIVTPLNFPNNLVPLDLKFAPIRLGLLGGTALLLLIPVVG
jgi:hypothetical protein